MFGAGGGRGGDQQEDPKFRAWIEALAREELGRDGAAAARAAGEPDGFAPARHDSRWYADRCAFCARCALAIDAEPGRRGARCAGCRRWFHPRCCAALAEGADGGSGGRFFHSAACREGYEALRAVAAEGRRPVEAPAPPGGLMGLLSGLLGGGQKQQQNENAEEPLTVRLLDLSELKRHYRAAQRSGALAARRRRVLEAAGLAAPRARAPAAPPATAGSGDNSSSSSGSESDSEAAPRAPRRAAGAAAAASGALDDFLLASELMTRQWPDDEPKDILEDSFAVLLARGRAPLAAASLNLYAPDHARVQSLVTAAGERRRGRAGELMRALTAALARAGVPRVVAIFPESTDEARGARERLFRRRLGFKELPIEELVELRRELPDYHKSLVGGATLLVRALEAAPAAAAAKAAPAAADAGSGGADARGG